MCVKGKQRGFFDVLPCRRNTEILVVWQCYHSYSCRAPLALLLFSTAYRTYYCCHPREKCVLCCCWVWVRVCVWLYRTVICSQLQRRRYFCPYHTMIRTMMRTMILLWCYYYDTTMILRCDILLLLGAVVVSSGDGSVKWADDVIEWF